MAIETYTYSIADDTPNGKVAPRNLDQEIRDETAITRELAGVTIEGEDLKIDFLAALTTEEETALDVVVAAHAGDVTIKAPEKLTASGVPIVQSAWREGNPTDFISFNWCDKTTWYSQSTRVTNEVMTDSGDGLTFNPAISRPWICVSCGKISQEHRLAENYGVVVTVDDVAVTESPPETTTGDFQIDHDTGDITFNADQTGNVVKATYSYAGSSAFYIEPLEGTTIRLTAVEVQFSDDVDLTTSVRFDIEGYIHAFTNVGVDDVTPNYTTTFPTGFRIPLGSPRIYKTMMDYIAEAQRNYPLIPPLGGTSWRGLKKNLHVMRWPYGEDATRDLESSKGMRVKVSLDNDVDFGGSYAVATFYAVSTNGNS